VGILQGDFQTAQRKSAQALTLVFACIVFSSTAVSAPDTIAVVQGEALQGGGSNDIVSESASGGRTLKVSTAWPAHGSLETSTSAYKILVRETGDTCNGSPTLELLINGDVVLTETFHDRNWKWALRRCSCQLGSMNLALD